MSGVLPSQQRVLLEASQKKAVPEKPRLNPPAQSHSDILRGWIWKPRSGVETGLMVAPYLNLTLSNVPKNKARARGSVSSVTPSKYLPADEQFNWSSITRSGSLVPRDAITQISPSKGAPPPGFHGHPGLGMVPTVELGAPKHHASSRGSAARTRHPLTLTRAGWAPKLLQLYLAEALSAMSGLYLGRVVQLVPVLPGRHLFPLTLSTGLMLSEELLRWAESRFWFHTR